MPLGRPLTGAFASGRAPPSPARIPGEPTGTAGGLAALGNRHADRTAGGSSAVGLETLVLGIHSATIDEEGIAQGLGAIAVERVDNNTPHPVKGATRAARRAASDGTLALATSEAAIVTTKIERKTFFIHSLRFLYLI